MIEPCFWFCYYIDGYFCVFTEVPKSCYCNTLIYLYRSIDNQYLSYK